MASIFGQAQQAIGLRSASPLECLDYIDGMKIREQVRPLEALSSVFSTYMAGDTMAGQTQYEQNNKYKVHKWDKDGGTGWDTLFEAKEKTGKDMRNLKQLPFLGDCIPWDLNIYWTEGIGNPKDYAFQLDRPASWTCMCCNRPMAELTDLEGQVIGRIGDPYSITGNYSFTIRDPDGGKLYDVLGGTSEDDDNKRLDFTITDDNGEERGSITKKAPKANFYRAEDLDNYYIDFGDISDASHKALVMATAIFMDFRYFNGQIAVPEMQDAMEQASALQQQVGGLAQPLMGSK